MVSVLQEQMKILGEVLQINIFSCLMFKSIKSKWFLLKNNVFLLYYSFFSRIVFLLDNEDCE